MAQLQELADRLRVLPSTEIDFIYNVLLRLDRNHNEESTDAIRNAITAVTEERDEDDERHNEAVDLLSQFHAIGGQVSLYDNFENALQQAGITLEEGSVSGPASIAEPEIFQDMNIHASRFDQQRLLSQALEAWRDAVQARRDMWLDFENPVSNAQADGFYQFNLLSKALSHWWNTYQETIYPMHLQESGLRSDHSDQLLRRMTKAWVLKTRAGQFARVQDMRIVRAAIDSMAQKYNEVKAVESVMIYEPLLIRSNLKQWENRKTQVQRMDHRAEDARDYFVMVKSLRKWRLIVSSRKQTRQEEEIKDKRILELNRFTRQLKFFRKWRAVVKSKKAATYNLGYKTIRTKNKENIARAALAEWQSKTRYNDTMHEIANDFSWQKQELRVKMTAHKAITTMYHKAMEKGEDEDRASQFQKKQLLNRNQILHKWQNKVTKLSQDTSRVTELESINSAQIASAALRKFNAKAFEMSRRHEDAEVFHLRYNKKRNMSLLDRWRRATAEKRGRLDLPPVIATPAARRSLLRSNANSTTPAYTPFVDRLQGRIATGTLFEEGEEDEEEGESDSVADIIARS